MSSRLRRRCCRRCGAAVLPRSRADRARTSRRWRSGTRRSCGSSRSTRDCGPASRTSRSTSTRSSTSRRWRCAGRGERPASSRSRPPPRTSRRGRYEYHLDFPGNALDPGLRLRALAAALTEGRVADRLRARRDRSRAPGQARAAVLAVLRLQRLEQPARGRLGDDPARLRRLDCGAGARDGRPSRSATASTRAPSGRPGTTTSSTTSTARIPVVHPAAGSHANFFDEALYLGSSARAGRRLRRHARAHHRRPPGRADDPERPGAGAAGVPVDRLPGPLGRAAARRSSTGRPGPNLKTQWTAADRAGPRAGAPAATRFRAAARSGPGRPASSAAPSAAARERWSSSSTIRSSSASCSPGSSLLVIVLAFPGDLAPVRSARVGAPPRLGPGPVRQPRVCTCRRFPLFLGIGMLFVPISFVVIAAAGARAARVQLVGVQTGGESNGLVAVVVLAIGTSLTLLGLGARPGCDRARAARDRRGSLDRTGPRLPAGRRQRRAAARRPARRDRDRLAARELDLPAADRDLARRSLGPDRPGRRARARLAPCARCAAAAASCAGDGSRSPR